MSLNPLADKILRELKDRLPPQLVYHSSEHTEDVIEEVRRFAIADALPAREIELLTIAAAYHDAGYLDAPAPNESFGAKRARRAMEEQGGFSSEEFALVEQAIMDTALQGEPPNLTQCSSSRFSSYLLDADLANLGRSDFFECTDRVMREIGVVEAEERGKFLRNLLAFMSAHRWHTAAAESLRGAKLRENTALLELRLNRNG